MILAVWLACFLAAWAVTDPAPPAPSPPWVPPSPRPDVAPRRFLVSALWDDGHAHAGVATLREVRYWRAQGASVYVLALAREVPA